MKAKGKRLTVEEWFKKTYAAFKDDLEYRFEVFISDITNNICKVMKENKVNRSQLAKKLEVSKPAVTRMLDGNPNFTLKRLFSVADALEQDLIVEFKPKKVLLIQAKHNEKMENSAAFLTSAGATDVKFSSPATASDILINTPYDTDLAGRKQGPISAV